MGRVSSLEHAWRAKMISLALQTDVFSELLRTRRPEFAAILMNQVDYVSHFYWKHSSPDLFPKVTPADEATYGRVVDDIYLEVDRCLSKVASVLPEGADVMIVSDHGFRPAIRKAAGRYCRIRTECLIETLGVEGTVFGTNLTNVVILRPTVGSANEQDELLDRLESALGDASMATEREPLFEVVRDGASITVSMRARDAIPDDATIRLAGDEHPFDEPIEPDRRPPSQASTLRTGFTSCRGPRSGGRSTPIR
jgi:hypothetical protein